MCECSCCHFMPTSLKCICCKEIDRTVAGIRTSETDGTAVTYITGHQGFKGVCPNLYVLQACILSVLAETQNLIFINPTTSLLLTTVTYTSHCILPLSWRKYRYITYCLLKRWCWGGWIEIPEWYYMPVLWLEILLNHTIIELFILQYWINQTVFKIYFNVVVLLSVFVWSLEATAKCCWRGNRFPPDKNMQRFACLPKFQWKDLPHSLHCVMVLIILDDLYKIITSLP